MSSCERPRKRSASVAVPTSVSNRYSLSTRTQGSSCRIRVSASPRRVCAFSLSRSCSRAASHSSRVPILWSIIVPLVSVDGTSFQSLLVFRQTFDLIKPFVPRRRDAVHPACRRFQPLGTHGELHFAALFARFDQPGLLENAQMLHDRLARHGEFLRQRRRGRFRMRGERV